MTAHDDKKLVARGYDEIVDAYLDQFGKSSVRAVKLAAVVTHLAPGAAVLDLGCGAGVPVARELARLGFDVTGVDASIGQIERARQNAPQARFILGDMASVDFAAGAFDAVVAFYAITHLPRSEHEPLIRKIADWLRPGGRFLASFGTVEGDWSGEWLGTPMFFSHNAPEATRRMVRDAGLVAERVEVVKQDNEDQSFLWITARKP